MATKKKEVVDEELKDASLMEIMASNGSKIFTKNTIIDYSYSTGIPVIDYLLGYEIFVRDENKQIIKIRKCLGMQAGSFNVLCGGTQSWKTTVGEQMAANIAHRYGGNVIHYDVENRLVLQRLMTMTKLPSDWFDGDNPRYMIRNESIGYDTLQEAVVELYKVKMSRKELLLKDTGEVDRHNKPIWLMPPTVMFVDSITSVIKNEYNVDDKKSMETVSDLRSNTYGMQSAKTLRGVLTDLLPMMKEANIIMIVIAHENDNPATGPTVPAKQFQYGKATKKISGGKALEYNASTVLSFTGESKDESRYYVNTDGFEGNTVLIEPTKLSTNESGNEKTGLGVRLVIDKFVRGCDNIRSLIKLLDAKGRLRGNRLGYVVLDKQGQPITNKFSWKGCYEDFEKDRESFKTFMITAREELECYISKAVDNDDKIDPMDLDSMIDSL